MVVDRRFLNFILWLLFIVSVVSIVFTMHYLFYLEWATEITIVIGIISFNLAMADIIRRYAEYHERNTVIWTTATILFSPFLALMAYFLTFPRGVKLGVSPDIWVVRVRVWKSISLLLGIGLCFAALVFVVTELWSPRFTSLEVINELLFEVPKIRRADISISTEYKGFGSWLVTLEGSKGSVEVIFHERTGEWK